MIKGLIRSLKRFVSRVKQHFKQWSKPAFPSMAVGSLSDLRLSRKDLIIENAMLRHQLIVLNRQVKRPQLTHRDRVRLVLLARLTEFWQQALHIVQPDTLLRWHRDLFRRYWRRKSKPERVAGLTMLIMDAVQVAALREYQVRRHITQTGELVQGLMPETRFSTWIISNKLTIPGAIRQVML